MVSTMDSDIDFSVFSENVFNNIIDGNKKSKLNFQLQRSPFSDFISIKKSFQKDRSGAMLLPSSFFMYQDNTMRELSLLSLIHNLQTTALIDKKFSELCCVTHLSIFRQNHIFHL